MNFPLQIGTATITLADLPTLLSRYQLWHPLVREILIDQATDEVKCPPEALAQAIQQHYANHQLLTLEEQQAWLIRQNLTQTQLEAQLTRKLKIEYFKQLHWGSKLESYFLRHKKQFDKAIYSLLRLQDPYLATELYFRLKASEQSFTELAKTYSLGPEAQTGGIIGPVALSNIHHSLAQLLSSSQPGQLHPPVRVDNWVVIVRLEKFIPAQLDDSMRQQLLHQMYESWLQDHINQFHHLSAAA